MEVTAFWAVTFVFADGYTLTIDYRLIRTYNFKAYISQHGAIVAVNNI